MRGRHTMRRSQLTPLTRPMLRSRRLRPAENHAPCSHWNAAGAATPAAEPSSVHSGKSAVSVLRRAIMLGLGPEAAGEAGTAAALEDLRSGGTDAER